MNYYQKVRYLTAAFCSTVFLASSASYALADTKGTTIDSVSILQDASETSKVISELDIGQSIDILKTEGDYFKIALEGAEKAFILDKYVSVIETDGVIVGDSVIVRNAPTVDAEEIGKLSYGEDVLVNGIIDDFYRVTYNGEEAYIHSDFIIGDMIYSIQKIDSAENSASEKTKFGTIVAESGVNLRREPVSDGEVVATLGRNSVLDVVADEGEWVKVIFENEELYINSEFFLIQTGVKPDEPPIVISTSESGGALADQIINYGKQFIGTPYSWGGTNLSSGVDCSGFTYAVMKANGVSLSRTSSSQVYDGQNVEKSQLKKGDLVFFDTSGPNNGRISHVGIYMGDGQFIHSSSGRKWGITIDSLYSEYYTRTYVTAARVL